VALGVLPRDAWAAPERWGADEPEGLAWREAPAVAGCEAMGEEEWKGEAMSDTPTPRTYAAQLHVADAYADFKHQDTGRPYLEHVVAVEFASQLERELQEAQARIRQLFNAGALALGYASKNDWETADAIWKREFEREGSAPRCGDAARASGGAA